MRRDPERPHQPAARWPSCARWWRSRAWCRRGCWCAAGPSRSIAFATTISACVESRPPETPITTRSHASRAAGAAPARRPGCCRPRSNPAPAARGSAGTKGKRSIRASQADIVGRWIEPERDASGSCRHRHRASGGCRRTSPAARAPAAAGRDRRRRPPSDRRPESARSRPALHPFSKIEACPSQARSVVDFAGAGGGIEIGREAARRLRSAQQSPRLGLADRDVARREVGEDGRAGQRRVRARRHRHPEILANLRVNNQPGHVLGREDQVRPERRAVCDPMRISSPSVPSPEAKWRGS